MKHTPGPWHILSGGFISNSVLSDWASDKHYVAQVKGGDIYNHANAQLIVAAPDLLGALKIITQRMEQGFNRANPKGSWTIMFSESDIKQIKQAIAKTEGR